MAQTFTVIVNQGGDDWVRWAVGIFEIVVGLGLLLTPLWVGRGWLRLRSSTEKSRDRHVLLFTVAGVMAIAGGVYTIIGRVNVGDSLIPLAMVGVAVIIAMIPGHADENN